MFWSKEKQEIRRLKDELDRLQARYLAAHQENEQLAERLEWAESELRLLGDRGDSVVYRSEREAFDRWQRSL